VNKSQIIITANPEAQVRCEAFVFGTKAETQLAVHASYAILIPSNEIEWRETFSVTHLDSGIAFWVEIESEQEAIRLAQHIVAVTDKGDYYDHKGNLAPTEYLRKTALALRPFEPIYPPDKVIYLESVANGTNESYVGQ